jgi:ribosomal protein L37E
LGERGIRVFGFRSDEMKRSGERCGGVLWEREREISKNTGFGREEKGRV